MRIMDERKHLAAAEQPVQLAVRHVQAHNDIMHAYKPWKRPDPVELFPILLLRLPRLLRQGDWRPGAAPPEERGRLKCN